MPPPAVFVAVAPPGSNVPLIVGSITFGITIVAALAAFSARETVRIRLRDLGNRHAEPVGTAEFERLRAETRLRR